MMFVLVVGLFVGSRKSPIQIGSQIGKRIPWIFSLFGGNSFADPQETETILYDPQETVDNPNRLAQSAPKSDQKRLDRTGLSFSFRFFVIK